MLNLRTPALLAAITAIVAVVSVPVSPSALASTSSPDALEVWAAQYMERAADPTLADAVADARNFDALFAHKLDYTPYIDEMKAANPDLTLVVYFNATFSRKKELASFPEEAFAHTADGRRIKHNSFELWLMEPSSTVWRQDRIRTCTAMMAESKYDACGLDNIGPAPLNPGYANGLAVNPATGAVYTADEWMKQTTALMTQMKAAISPTKLYANSLGNGPAYFKADSPSKQMLAPLDGATIESFVRGGRDPITKFPSVKGWKMNVDMLVDAGRDGKTLWTVTKTWTTATQAQKDAVHKFALGSFLLGTDGNHRFWFTSEFGTKQTVYYPIWDTPIGTPLGDYYTNGDNVYERDFTGGKVVVNPDEVARVVSLEPGLRNEEGVDVTSVTLPPHTAEILTS